jgi:hypothetical protein
MFKFLAALVEDPICLCVHRQAAAIGVFLRFFRFGGLPLRYPQSPAKMRVSGISFHYL